MNIYTLPVGTLQTNCYILASDASSAAIVDPGAEGDRIAKAVKMLGLTPKMILLTHGHHDHIGGIRRVREAYPDLKVYVGEKDAEMVRDVKKNFATMRYADIQEFEGLREDVVLHEGDELELDELRISVIETPGHTMGGVTYRCGTTLFTGDTLFRQSIGRTDLYGGDMDTIISSIYKLYALEGDFDVLPGHGSRTTLETERRTNPYVRA